MAVKGKREVVREFIGTKVSNEFFVIQESVWRDIVMKYTGGWWGWNQGRKKRKDEDRKY